MINTIKQWLHKLFKTETYIVSKCVWRGIPTFPVWSSNTTQTICISVLDNKEIYIYTELKNIYSNHIVYDDFNKVGIGKIEKCNLEYYTITFNYLDIIHERYYPSIPILRSVVHKLGWYKDDNLL